MVIEREKAIKIKQEVRMGNYTKEALNCNKNKLFTLVENRGSVCITGQGSLTLFSVLFDSITISLVNVDYTFG